MLDIIGVIYMIFNISFEVVMLDIINLEICWWFKYFMYEMVKIGVCGWMVDFGELFFFDCCLYLGEDLVIVYNKYLEMWVELNCEFVEEWE